MEQATGAVNCVQGVACLIAGSTEVVFLLKPSGITGCALKPWAGESFIFTEKVKDCQFEQGTDMGVQERHPLLEGVLEDGEYRNLGQLTQDERMEKLF